MKKEELKEYAVNVVYKMIHTVYVTASSKREAKEAAIEAFTEGMEEDFSGDEMDGIDHASVVDWWPEANDEM